MKLTRQLVSKHRIMFKSGFTLEQGNNDVPDDQPDEVKRFIDDLIKHREAYPGEDPSQPSAAARSNGIEGVAPPDGEIQTEEQRAEANRTKAAMDEQAQGEQKRAIEKLDDDVATRKRALEKLDADIAAKTKVAEAEAVVAKQGDKLAEPAPTVPEGKAAASHITDNSHRSGRTGRQ